MTVPIHVLGSDTPRHNRTVLWFSNSALAAANEHARGFMVVSRDDGLSDSYLTLSVQFFPGEKSLTEAVIVKVKANHQQRFLFHGRPNPKLWLAPPSGGIKPSQFFWHTQGADLYELSSDLRYKFFYPLCRLAQKRVGYIFATRGDLSFFTKTYPKIRGEPLYFPTRTNPSLNMMVNDQQREGKMAILVGNFGDHSNKHITTLRAVHQQLGDTVKVVVLMGYSPNNETCTEEARQAGLELFSEENLQVLSEKLEFGAYLTLSRQCDLGYFIFACQQGIGTLCSLIQAGISCALNRENPFWQNVTGQRLPVPFTIDDLSEDIVREVQHQLASMGKNTIAFSSPNCLQGRQQALAIAAGEIA